MKSSTIWTIIALVTAGLIGGIIALSQKEAVPYTEFAQCLEEKGAVFHGAWWCSHCIDQKALFKGGKKDLPYNECSNSDKSTKQNCKDLNIGIEGGTGFPTWEFADGTFSSGGKTFSELSELSGCAIPSEIAEQAAKEVPVENNSSEAPALN